MQIVLRCLESRINVLNLHIQPPLGATPKVFQLLNVSTMKKLLLLFVLCVAAALPAAAQKAELTASYGGFTQMDVMKMHGVYGDVNNAWGTVNIGLNFKVAQKFWIGPSYTFSSTEEIKYNVIMLNGRYGYYENSIVKLYGKLGIGVDITHLPVLLGIHHYSRNCAYFAFQIVPIGAQVDLSRHWAIFGEAGFGAQGLLQVGAKYKF